MISITLQLLKIRHSYISKSSKTEISVAMMGGDHASKMGFCYSLLADRPCDPIHHPC
jgi:hypothetical protein